MMTVATERFGSPEFDYEPVDFTIDYEEVPYEELIKQQEEQIKQEQGGGFMSILPFGSKKKSEEGNFEEIPVQINDGLLDRIKGKDKTEESVEEN